MVKLAKVPMSKMHQRVSTAVGMNTPLPTPNKTPPPNTFWDSARSTYTDSMLAVELTHGKLCDFLEMVMADPARMAKIQDPTTLTANIELLTKDIGEHKTRLEAIYAQHAHRSGTTTDADDTMTMLKVNGEYTDALEVYDTVVMPTVNHIFEQIGVIEEALLEDQRQRDAKLAEQALTALQDPNVISDVQIKDKVASHA